jgi:hypothetical protein
MPGMNFLAQKRENFWCINSYKNFNPQIFPSAPEIDQDGNLAPGQDASVDHPFFPETFLIPDNFNEYVATHTAQKGQTYVSKVNKGCQGYGIKLIKHPKNLRLKKIGKNDDMVI